MPSTANDLLRRLARLGATRRIAELHDEENDILRQFPDLKKSASSASPEPSTPAAEVPKRTRRKMTAAQRKAVGVRMKKYWEQRRSAAKKK